MLILQLTQEDETSQIKIEIKDSGGKFWLIQEIFTANRFSVSSEYADNSQFINQERDSNLRVQINRNPPKTFISIAQSFLSKRKKNYQEVILKTYILLPIPST